MVTLADKISRIGRHEEIWGAETLSLVRVVPVARVEPVLDLVHRHIEIGSGALA